MMRSGSLTEWRHVEVERGSRLRKVCVKVGVSDRNGGVHAIVLSWLELIRRACVVRYVRCLHVVRRFLRWWQGCSGLLLLLLFLLLLKELGTAIVIIRGYIVLRGQVVIGGHARVLKA